MAKTDDTSKSRGRREQLEQPVSAATPAAASSADPNSVSFPLSRSTLEHVIEAERRQLLQAHGVLTCLYEVLLYADGEDAVTYAEAAHVAKRLVSESVERLDLVRLRPLIAALKRGENPQGVAITDADVRGANEIKEESPPYLC